MLHIQAFIVMKLRLVSIWRKSQKKKTLLDVLKFPHFRLNKNYHNFTKILRWLNSIMFKCSNLLFWYAYSYIFIFAYCNRAADFTSFLEDILPCLMNSLTQRFLKTSSVYVCGYLCGLCGNIGHEMFMVDKNK